MQKLVEGLTLYHGSYCEVKNPLLEKCAKRKDFGQGFYLTTSKEQAVSFLKTAVGKALITGKIQLEQNYGVVSIFKVNLKKDLRTYILENADAEWLHCVAAHRRRGLFPEIEKAMSEYDVIIGKIANDQTNATLTAFISGVFGEVGSKTADDFCISRLLPQKLQNQFCFRTDAAIACLEFVESEQVWLRK